nr:type II toxin-antitoxin system death-on-curing family toxin [Halobellus rarus]
MLVAEHPFVDGNKRTAIRTVVVFYMTDGYTFEYSDEIRALLHRFATDEAAVVLLFEFFPNRDFEA